MRRLQRSFGLHESLVHADQRFAQRRRLESPRQNRALSLKASAGNRAAARNLLAAERYDRIAQTPAANQLDAGI